MFHQPHNTFGANIYNSVTYSDSHYEPHFHKSFEIWYCAAGKADFYADGTHGVLQSGDYMLIFPYIAHGFSVSAPSSLWVAVFSGDFIPELQLKTHSLKPEIRPFHVSPETQNLLDKTLIGRDFPPCETPKTAAALSESEIYRIKAGLYCILGAFNSSARMLSVPKADDVTMEIIRYIEDNFTSDITLKSAANALGYNYQHLSRVFKKTLNMNFRSLINQYRFDYACRLLQKGGVSVTRAALDAGFQSVRNFNRIYREKTGRSPKITHQGE